MASPQQLTALLAAIAGVGCVHVSAQPSPQRLAVDAALRDATVHCEAADALRCAQGLAAAKGLAADDPSLCDQVAELEATVLVEAHDAAAAAQVLADRLALAVGTRVRAALNLHDKMIFLCELRGDRLCAQLEADEMMSAVESFPERLSARERQGAYWQRAHTLRQVAQTLQGPQRAAAILYARRARDVFAELARASGHALGSITLLDEEFAALDGDCARALAIARSLAPDSLDPQDAFTTATVAQQCGDVELAKRLRAKILATPGFDLFDAVYRQLARAAEDLN